MQTEMTQSTYKLINESKRNKTVNDKQSSPREKSSHEHYSKEQLFLITLVSSELITTGYLLYPSVNAAGLNFNYWDTQHTVILGVALFMLLFLNKKVRQYVRDHPFLSVFYVFALAIAAGVACGEAAAAGNFIKTYLEDHNHLLGMAITNNAISIIVKVTLVSAFILSLALFFVGIKETREEAERIKNIIRHGEHVEKDKDGKPEVDGGYKIWQQVVLGLSVFGAIAAAFVCGALAYNSMLGLHMTKLQAIGVWGLDLFAYTCVFTGYFVLVLKDLFKLHNSKTGLWGAIKDRNDRVGGIPAPDQSQQTITKQQRPNRINQILFWGLFGVLSVAVAIVSYGLFYGQVCDFSLQVGSFTLSNIPSGWAHAITTLAMIVDFMFRWKSIWMILNFVFNKSYRKEKWEGKEATTISNAQSNGNQVQNNKSSGIAIIFIWGILGILPAIINGIGQGAGAFYAADILPKWLSPDMMLGFYFASLVIGSAGANAFSVLDIIKDVKHFFWGKEETGANPDEAKEDNANIDSESENLSFDSGDCSKQSVMA